MAHENARSESLKQLVEQIEHQPPVLLLPEFQRDFVWEMDQTYALFDSLIRNIFVGSVIYGKPSFGMTLRHLDKRPRRGAGSRARIERKDYSDDEIRQASEVDQLKIVLDGQQRTTSIYRALRGIDRVYFMVRPDVTTEDMARGLSLENLLAVVTGGEAANQVSVPLDYAFTFSAPREKDVKKFFASTTYGAVLAGQEDAFEEAFGVFFQVLTKFKTLFEQPQLLSYYLLDMSLDKFTTFFERSNSRGIQLNFTDILAAKVFGQFKLREALEAFGEANPGVPVNRELLVRAVAVLSGRVAKIEKAQILKELRADDFKAHWMNVTRLYVRVLEYLHEQRFMVAVKWLPYDNMLLPIMAFSHELEAQGQTSMTEKQRTFLRWWYWASVFSERYTAASNEKIVQDARVLQRVARGERLEGTYFARFRPSVDEAEELLSYSRSASSIYRGVLNLLHFRAGGLRDWTNNGLISTGKLGAADLQDHHYFPKAFLASSAAQQDLRADEIESIRDSVLNRVLMPKDTNLKVGAKMPFIYLGELLGKNTHLREGLASHAVPVSLLEEPEQSHRVRATLLSRGETILKFMREETVERESEVRAAYGPEVSS